MGISDRRMRERKSRKNDIINAAEELFFSKGYENTSINEIMNQAELGKGTFYLYFSSKEDMYHAIALRGMEKLLPLFEQAAKIDSKGIDIVIRLGYTLLQFYKDFPDYFMLMTYDGFRGITNENTPTQQELTVKSAKLMEIIMGAIQLGIDDQSINNKLDPRAIMFITMSATQSLIRSSFPKNDELQQHLGVSADDIFATYSDLLFRAISNHQTNETMES